MKIGLIGTGLMGFPMAEKLIENKIETMVYNRTAEKAFPLRQKGAKLANRVSDIFHFADVIILMLADYHSIKKIINDIEFNHDIENKCIVQMGTILPKESIEIASFFNKKECEYLEAPVLGSIKEVRAKNLIILAGGRENIFKKYYPILEIFGKDIHYIGETGNAAAIKLALNQLIVSLTAAFSISYSYLKKNDIDTNLFMDIVRGSALYAPTFDKKLQNYENQNFDQTNFPLQLMLKDINLIKDEIDRSEIDSSILFSIKNIIKKALAKGFKDKDYSSLYMGIYDR